MFNVNNVMSAVNGGGIVLANGGVGVISIILLLGIIIRLNLALMNGVMKAVAGNNPGNPQRGWNSCFSR